MSAPDKEMYKLLIRSKFKLIFRHSTEEGKKKIDPKKLEKQLKFEEKQAKLALQKQNQEPKQPKVEKPKPVEQEEEKMPDFTI